MVQSAHSGWDEVLGIHGFGTRGPAIELFCITVRGITGFNSQSVFLMTTDKSGSAYGSITRGVSICPGTHCGGLDGDNLCGVHPGWVDFSRHC